MSDAPSNIDPFALLDFITIPMWVYDPTDLRIVATNAAAISRYGYSREEFTAMTLARLRPDDPDDATALGSSGVRRHRLRDGTILFVEVQMRQIRVLGRDWCVETAYDVTPLHVATDHLRASEARLRAFVESNLMGFASGRIDGPIVEANQAFLDMTGCSRAELDAGAIPFSMLCPPPPDDGICGEKNGATARSYGKELVRRDGRRVPVLVNAAQPRPGEATAFIVDLTERRAMAQRLALADRLATIGTLAASVAHELNSPLTYVTTNVLIAQEMLAEVRAPADLGGALADARLGTDRMAAIVRDLRLLSRPQQDDVGPVDLIAAIDVAVRMAFPTFRSCARLECDHGAVPRVLANEARLTQAVLNLLVNAGQAIDAGDADHNHITIATRTAPSGDAVIDISDTGCGMAPEVRQHIFEPFFTTKPSGVGTGLGLAIVRQIVLDAGGHIECESAPGRGTRFRVTLPAAPPQQVGSRGAGRPRVLSIDDDPSVCKMLRRALPECDLALADSAAAALRLLDAGERFDAVLCDMVMPAMSGLDFYNAVCARDQLLAERIIILTGVANPWTMVPRHLHARVLEKPATKSQLLDAIAAAIGLDRLPAAPPVSMPG